MFIRNGDKVLFAQHAPVNPPGAAELLTGRAVKIFGAQAGQQGQTESAFKMAPLGAGTHICQATRAVLVHQDPHFGGDFVNGPIPGNRLKTVAHLFERFGQTLLGVLVVDDIESFATGIPLAARVRLIGPHFHHSAVFDPHFEPAVLSAQNAPGLFPFTHSSSIISQKIFSPTNLGTPAVVRSLSRCAEIRIYVSRVVGCIVFRNYGIWYFCVQKKLYPKLGIHQVYDLIDVSA